jgi:hypothetical protein
MPIRRASSLALAVSIALTGIFTLKMSTSANPKPSKTITFSKEIAPIFYKQCAECHRPGEGAPFSALTYKEVRPWAKSIKEKVSNRTMPPWHADPHSGSFQNNRSLSKQEIDTIVAWVEGGAPEGNVKDLPPAPKFTDGWNIPTPDAIIQIPEEYTYKPGADEYQYFDVATNFTEDKYVSFAEARPTNRKVVHHILAFIVPPGSANMSKMTSEQRYKAMEAQLKNSPFYRDGYLMRVKPEQPVVDDGCAQSGGRGGWGSDLLVGYAPGNNAALFPAGVTRKVPAGATIRFQIHYSNQTLGGTDVEKDRSMVGLVFSKTPPEKLMTTNSVGNILFKIPAGAENHKVTACRTLKRDTIIYGLLPHMHLRGKAMDYQVIYPDGKTETLLSVPKYDFAWQTNYLLSTPKRLPAGARIMVTSYFDNSAKNKFNPDPTKDVRYGEPTYDEMMLGFMDFVTENPPIAQVDPKILDSYTGKYMLEVMNATINVAREGNKLVVQLPMRPRLEFVPMSDTKFFVVGSDADLVILKNDKGEVIGAELGNTKAKKIKDEAASGQ